MLRFKRTALATLSAYGLAAMVLNVVYIGREPSRLLAQAPQSGQSTDTEAQPPFPDLSIPPQADEKTLSEIIRKAKSSQPVSPEQYRAMQTAIRDASQELLTLLEANQQTPRYQQAELDMISASVALMTYFGEDAKRKTLEQVHAFLKSRQQLSLPDIQTGMLAAAMLELQPDKGPARDTYQLLDRLLAEDHREEMQSLRVNLQAAVRRLNLLGHKLELSAQSLDGQQIDVDDYAGKYLIVDFFASWCEPCLSEVPRLRKHLAKYREKGLEVVGVSLDGDVESLNAYLEKARLPWPIIHDNADDPQERLQMKLGVSSLPTVLLLNKEGIVVSLEARDSELDRIVQMLFETPTPAAGPVQEDASGGKSDSTAEEN